MARAYKLGSPQAHERKVARDWIAYADRICVIGEAPEPDEPVYVTVIVGTAKEGSQHDHRPG